MSSNKHSMHTVADTLMGGSHLSFKGSGTSISALLDRQERCKVISVKIHFSTAISSSEELTISSEDVIEGTRCNFVYYTQDAQGLTDIIFTEDLFLHEHERLTINYPNSDGVDWGVTIIFAEEKGHA